jgi:RNA 2',3'-cyclic 3'-phosphodiesterase
VGAEPLGEDGPVKVRAFFGLPLPEGHRAALAGYLAECAQRAPELRWTPPENLHLTVRFLGHLDVAIAEGIADRLVESGMRSFELRMGEVGSFKRGRMARVVWLGVASDQEIAAMAAQVEAECVAAGLEPETRRYHAHLTLARAKARDGAVLPELPVPPALDPWRADELILYRSRLGRGGSVYEPLRRIRLS